MIVTAFIRPTKQKDRASVYIRVRDKECDMKCATELTINPSNWDKKRQCCKNRVVVRQSEREEFNNAVADLKRIISKEYFVGAGSEWLKNMIFVFHHPNAFKFTGNNIEEVRLSVLTEKYIEAKGFDKRQAVGVRSLVGKLERFETYQRFVNRKREFTMNVDTITASDLQDFCHFLAHEHEYVRQFPSLYKGMSKGVTEAVRCDNTLHNVFTKLRTVVNWCIHRGITENNPFLRFDIPKAVYGTPWYLTIEERDRIYDLDLSDSPHLATFRDMFIFQCFIGCRFGDLVALSSDNVIGDVLVYLPQKTKNKNGSAVRVPLSEKALAIYERFKAKDTKRLFPQYNVADFNNGIREVMRLASIDRKVPILNPHTHASELHPIYEIASSHAARRTFIGNLYKQVQDPNLISSMSGHANGSKAFARYRTIDDDMKRDLVNLIS